MFLKVNLKWMSIALDINYKTLKKLMKKMNDIARRIYLRGVPVIGGEGIEVEVDESKFGKRKYNRGHVVDGVWVLGMVERTPERRMALIPVIQRDHSTLKFLIENFINHGSILLTDGWRGYRGIEQRYIHHVVNHSEYFVDPISGTHTNTIEGNWSALKGFIEKRLRTRKKIWLPLLVAMERRNGSIKTFLLKLL